MTKEDAFIGRQWLVNCRNSNIAEGCSQIPAVKNNQCQRCGSRLWARLPDGHLYCRACIGLGRLVSGDYLVRNLQAIKFTPPATILTWRGNLTTKQKKLSDQLKQNFKDRQDTLVHAVTGAGKTEMLFAAIAECLRQGKRACLATPRIDVVNELYPRFQQAFAHVKVGRYDSQDFCPPALDQLTICTTHQLLKFYHAFDLLVIDEVDSFPYVGNAILSFATDNAVKEKGCRFYLTATPPAKLLRAAKQGHCQYLRLNRRYHGGPLPLPQEKFFWRPLISRKGLNRCLLQEIVKAARQKHPLLIFVPRIAEISLFLKELHKIKQLRSLKMAGVYAADPNRLQKVVAFRHGQIQLLVTTTILERGVTFKHVWVIVVAAEDQVYTTASLVQIAGRVGRAADDPTGLVLFCYHRYTQQLREARKQIRKMNQ